MRIEKEVFARQAADRARLAAHGFCPRGGSLFRAEDFLGGAFRAEVTVGPEGDVLGRVIEKETGEEYLPVHVEAHAGAFAITVREAYRALLQRIAEDCFTPLPFLSAQANRLAALIGKRYGEQPDYPFAKLPTYGVFRFPANRKWYALIMDIPRSRLLHKAPKKGEEDPLVEIVNLKARPEEMPSLLKVPGIYPGYHMQRASWLSVLLDGTVPDGEIMRLIDTSRGFAAGTRGAAAQEGGGPRSWIVPANPRYYDVEAALRDSRDILWKQSSRVRAGDIVYLYLAAPVSAVRYRLEVLEADIPYAYRDENVRMTHVMRLRLLAEYPPALFGFARLNELGVRAVRGPRLAPQAFLRAAEEQR